MSTTRGGPKKRKEFAWRFDPAARTLTITKQQDKTLAYSVRELHNILDTLWNYFGHDFFPLANNVERLGKGAEKLGLGTAILENLPKDIARAQGASYLGVVLEECGFLEWNKEHGGIAWRLLETDFSPEALEARLQGRGG